MNYQNSLVWQQAKKDYATGTYWWYDLQQKYNLPVDVIFAIIEEVRNCSTKLEEPNCTTKG